MTLAGGLCLNNGRYPNKEFKMKTCWLAAFAALCALGAAAQDLALPAPKKDGGLMRALQNRRSSRAFDASRPLSASQLSTLLWAAFGINRADGRRTAPTGRNVQDVEVYAVTRDGAYRYDAAKNLLSLVEAGDHRDLAGTQDFPKTAPLNVFVVQDMAKAMRAGDLDKAMHGGIHAGAIMQNILLFCADAGLACVPRLSIDKAGLGKILKLTDSQRIVIGVTVGYPAE